MLILEITSNIFHKQVGENILEGNHKMKIMKIFRKETTIKQKGANLEQYSQ